MDGRLDAQYWDQRYRNNDFAWDLGAISTPLKTYFDQLKNREQVILIPGAGNSYEAEYLFENGFTNIFICDISEAAIQNFINRCPAFNADHIFKADFFELKDSHFDLIIEQTFFCALDPDLRQAYFNKVSSLLNTGGKLVGLFFNDVLNKNKPPFGGNKEEYLKYIQVPLQIKIFETCYNSIKPRHNREFFAIIEKISNS